MKSTKYLGLLFHEPLLQFPMHRCVKTGGGEMGGDLWGQDGGERDAGVETHVFISSDANWEMLGADR